MYCLVVSRMPNCAMAHTAQYLDDLLKSVDAFIATTDAATPSTAATAVGAPAHIHKNHLELFSDPVPASDSLNNQAMTWTCTQLSDDMLHNIQQHVNTRVNGNKSLSKQQARDTYRLYRGWWMDVPADVCGEEFLDAKEGAASSKDAHAKKVGTVNISPSSSQETSETPRVFTSTDGDYVVSRAFPQVWVSGKVVDDDCEKHFSQQTSWNMERVSRATPSHDAAQMLHTNQCAVCGDWLPPASLLFMRNNQVLPCIEGCRVRHKKSKRHVHNAAKWEAMCERGHARPQDYEIIHAICANYEYLT